VHSEDPEECWQSFCQVDAGFPQRFAAHRYFRGQGWLPKLGSKYGVDFLLYQATEEAPHTHAVQCAVVLPEGGVPWLDVHRYHRLAVQVGKGLVIATVQAAPESAVGWRDVVAAMGVRAISLRRWGPGGGE